MFDKAYYEYSLQEPKILIKSLENLQYKKQYSFTVCKFIQDLLFNAHPFEKEVF
mgnify:CR=1 FL=1